MSRKSRLYLLSLNLNFEDEFFFLHVLMPNFIDLLVMNELWNIEQNDNTTRRLLLVSVNYYPTLFPYKYTTPLLLSFSISQSLQPLNPV